MFEVSTLMRVLVVCLDLHMVCLGVVPGLVGFYTEYFGPGFWF